MRSLTGAQDTVVCVLTGALTDIVCILSLMCFLFVPASECLLCWADVFWRYLERDWVFVAVTM